MGLTAVIDVMNLAAVDLNLLVAFEALFEERNVTRARQRIGLAQPSMSSALMRMRALFADELFVRTSKGMVPTARAFELAGPVGEALSQIRRAVDRHQSFDRATTRGRRFTVAVTDYADLVVIPAMVRALRARAPGVELRVRPLDRTLVHEQIDRGEVDAAIAGHQDPPGRCAVQRLFEERFVCIADPGNPVIVHAGLTVASYIQAPHALFAPDDDGTARGVIDSLLDAQGLRRNVLATFPHITAIPFAVRGTDLVATLSERAARIFAELVPIAIHPLPFSGLMPFGVDFICAQRVEADAGLAWLRATAVEVSASL
jgi:DNA-binding transcriptional LysR family regulator